VQFNDTCIDGPAVPAPALLAFSWYLVGAGVGWWRGWSEGGGREGLCGGGDGVGDCVVVAVGSGGDNGGGGAL
jgi:hypothetical protein